MTKTALLIFLIAGILLHGACSAADDLQTFLDFFRQSGNKPAIGTVLPAAEIVRKITDAIRSDADLQALYDQIPEPQRKNLSRDQFQQYIQLLRRGITGDILSFSRMKDEELDLVRETMIAKRPDQTEFVEQLQGYWIYHQQSGQQETQFALFIHVSADGRAYLSEQWVEQILGLADYAMLYFDAVDYSNEEALATLLQPEIYSPAVRIAKAKRIIDFYSNNIDSQTREFKLDYARIDAIGFVESPASNSNRAGSAARKVEIVFRLDGHYKINDIIPDQLKAEDLELRYNSEPLFHFIHLEQEFPAQIRSAAIEAVLGEPQQHDDLNCQTNSDGISQLQLVFDAAELKITGECFRHNRWVGQVIGIRIIEPALSLSGGLKTGIRAEDVLLLYPFADETGYRIESRTAFGRIILTMGIDNDQVIDINLEWIAD